MSLGGAIAIGGHYALAVGPGSVAADSAGRVLHTFAYWGCVCDYGGDLRAGWNCSVNYGKVNGASSCRASCISPPQ